MTSYQVHNANPSGVSSRQTVAQQHLTDFFSFENDSERARVPQREDFQVLASALDNLNHDSPIVQNLVELLNQDAADSIGGYSERKGVSQQYIDSLDRIPNKKLRSTDECAICATKYLQDEYPLVVRLPCHPNHHFDLECIGPWLKLHATCPLCRKDLKKKEVVVIEDSEEEDADDMYG